MEFFVQTFVHFWWPSTRTSAVSGVGDWQGMSYFGVEADILWIQHMATQIALESFKSLVKNRWKA